MHPPITCLDASNQSIASVVVKRVEPGGLPKADLQRGNALRDGAIFCGHSVLQ